MYRPTGVIGADADPVGQTARSRITERRSSCLMATTSCITRGERRGRGVYVAGSMARIRHACSMRMPLAVFVPPADLLFVRQGTLFAARFDPDAIGPGRRAGSPWRSRRSRSVESASRPFPLRQRGPSSIAQVQAIASGSLPGFDRSGKQVGVQSAQTRTVLCNGPPSRPMAVRSRWVATSAATGTSG